MNAGGARSAKTAIRRWFRDHPKTFCPVVGQGVCKHGGCDNPVLRADQKCNIVLKMDMASRAHALNDDRPWIADMRQSPDGRSYFVNFSFDRLLLQDLKSVIPPTDRTYDSATREWRIDRRHWGILNAMFRNFADWDLELGKRRRATKI